MLILAHPDGLGVDLHQLGQGVLKPPGDGHRRAEIHVILGELLGGQLGGGVDAGPRLADHHIADPGVYHLQQLRRHDLRFFGGGAVADGNDLHPVLFHQLGKGGDGLLLLPFPEGGVDHGGVQYFTSRVHHRHLAAVAVARVQTHGHLALDGGLHEKGL